MSDFLPRMDPRHAGPLLLRNSQLQSTFSAACKTHGGHFQKLHRPSSKRVPLRYGTARHAGTPLLSRLRACRLRLQKTLVAAPKLGYPGASQRMSRLGLPLPKQQPRKKPMALGPANDYHRTEGSVLRGHEESRQETLALHGRSRGSGLPAGYRIPTTDRGCTAETRAPGFRGGLGEAPRLRTRTVRLWHGFPAKRHSDQRQSSDRTGPPRRSGAGRLQPANLSARGRPGMARPDRPQPGLRH